MDKSKKPIDQFKVLPLTDKEKRLSVANALMFEVNKLTNEAKQKDFELKKIRQRLDHLRGLLKPKAKPAAKPAKKPAPKKEVAKKVEKKPAAKPAKTGGGGQLQAQLEEKKAEAAPVAAAPVVL